jgi:hypothetical protein
MSSKRVLAQVSAMLRQCLVHDVDRALGVDDAHDGREQHAIPDLRHRRGHLQQSEASSLDFDGASRKFKPQLRDHVR